MTRVRALPYLQRAGICLAHPRLTLGWLRPLLGRDKQFNELLVPTHY
ncbi:MAG TPA: hypothetical protein VFA81_07245 [Burkholderiales bacterium]|nr:hypothetical protein [Burkholderiales bacterium]